MIGQTLSHFKITAMLGEGGMGEVYRAEDTKLGREVAIKVMPSVFTEDPERLARFEREAKVLASLNHPNIATLFGLETADAADGAVSFLVMELVEGDDLADRIQKGPLPLGETIAIGRQIADGLEAAHARGIVHRDLKPANIRISADGTVKILDFGLAKAWEPSRPDADFTQSPTITADMTRAGTILGTAPYMSPEQTVGKDVDRRTDIWAFGCVLYEMLTGHRAFDGTNATEILAKILEREPEWGALAPELPQAARRLIGRCLEKDPTRRLRDAGDVGLALEDLTLAEPLPAETVASPPKSPVARLLPWVGTGAAVVLALLAWLVRPAPEELHETVLRFTEVSPAPLDPARIGGFGSAVALSPDGEILVWVAATDEGTQLFMRRLADEEAMPIPGTEGARVSTFSPDGEWIGFWADGKLQKVPIRGGVPQTICGLAAVDGISWGDGVIVTGSVGDGRLWRIDPAGGQPELIEFTNDPEYEGAYPQVLPGGKTVLSSSPGGTDLVSLDTGEVTPLLSEGSSATYLPTGHLVWAQRDSLLAAPFDLSSLTITGEAQTVIQGILAQDSGRLPHYAVSWSGTLAYLPGSIHSAGRRQVWMSHDGKDQPLPVPAQSYLQSPQVSPDGQRILITRPTTSTDIWVVEPDRGMMTPVAPDDGTQFWAIWTPDGENVIFNWQHGSGPANLWIQPVDRSGPPRRLTESPAHQPPQDITSDGRTVLYTSAIGSTAAVDIELLHLDGDPRTEPLLATTADEFHPALSPDDRWLAYSSDATGRAEIYVQPFPALGATIRVSPDGGVEPLWSPSGDRLYYRSENGRQVFAVDVEQGEPLRFGRELLLFEGDFPGSMKWGRQWDIHPDGERFLMLRMEGEDLPDGIHVVVNWASEVERIVSSGGG